MINRWQMMTVSHVDNLKPSHVKEKALAKCEEHLHNIHDDEETKVMKVN